MGTTITIRNVPKETHAELKARAERAGKSLQEYLRSELVRMADKPDIEAWIGQVRQHWEAVDTHLTTEQILEYRDLDRK